MIPSANVITISASSVSPLTKQNNTVMTYPKTPLAEPTYPTKRATYVRSIVQFASPISSFMRSTLSISFPDNRLSLFILVMKPPIFVANLNGFLLFCTSFIYFFPFLTPSF